LRILTVGNMYPPHHAGGYEVMWQAAVRRARSLGHEVRVLVSDHHQASAGDETDPDVHRTLRWYWDQTRYEFPRLSVLNRLGVERANAAELERHLWAFRPDVISWWSMGCMSLALVERVRRIGLPASFVVHDDWIVYGRHHDQWIRMWRGRRRAVAPAAERLLGVPTRVDLDQAGTFVFNSQYTLDRARETGFKPATAKVVHPGIDESFLEAAAAEPWQWRLVYVGRIDRQKGVDTAVRALARLPAAARLSIWGAGDDRYVEEMRRLADELRVGDRVHFHGWVAPEDLAQVYASADAVMFPVRWNEPFGLVPLESMGIGRPVVATARGGAAEFLRHEENALVFEADDDEALAASVSRLAQDEGLRARLREAGRRTAAQHTITEFAQRTVDEIVAAARAAQPAASGRHP
jgi:glycosyltransferase involved in cell wall biosynthesis